MSGLPWFRLYADMVDNETVRLLAFEDRWHFVAILCCKCAGVLDGGDPLPLLRRKMGVKLGLASRELDAMADRLGEIGLIDAETFQPCNWDDLQFKSDSSKDRVKRYRDRRAAAGHDRSGSGYLQHHATLMQRDNGCCVYCGSVDGLCIDHMVPLVAGGGDEVDNLALACKRCNSGKAGRTPAQAGYRIEGAAAATAHARYLSRPVTVTVTPQDKETDTELLSEKVTTPPACGGPVGSFEGHEAPKATPNPVAAFAIALGRAGFRCTALNPDLVAYVAEGGTVEHLTQAASLPECAGKPATYAIRIARRELTQPAAPVAASAPRYAAPSEPRRVDTPEQTRAHLDATKAKRPASAATAQDALALAQSLLKGATA